MGFILMTLITINNNNAIEIFSVSGNENAGNAIISNSQITNTNVGISTEELLLLFDSFIILDWTALIKINIIKIRYSNQW